MLSLIRQENGRFPLFAPPIIRKGSFEMAQAQAIMRHLGTLFGLCPQPPEGFAHADQICHTVSDFHTEGRACFHPIKPVESHSIQVEESKSYVKDFVATRLPLYLNYFESILLSNRTHTTHTSASLQARTDRPSGQFFVGGRVTYADISVFHVMRAAAAQFPEAWEAADIPLLKAFQQSMASRPNIAAFLASSRSHAFAGDSMM